MFDLDNMSMFKHETPDDRLALVKDMPVRNTEELTELIAILLMNVVNSDGLLVAPKLATGAWDHISYCWQIAYQLEKLGIVKYV